MAIRKHSDTVNALRQSSLFMHLTDNALDSVAHKTKLRQFFPGEAIVWQGDASDSLYVIANGIVAVQKLMPNNENKVLAYLMPGNTFGEVGILENQPRSATVVAHTDVDVLVLRRKDFVEILYNYPSVGIELAKMLARYLTETNKRISRGNSKARMIMILDLFEGQGATSIGVMLAQVMAEKTGQRTIYTEHPFPQKLVADMNIDRKTKLVKHKSGYDLLVAPGDTSLPDAVRTAFLLDKLSAEYDNIIITVNESLDEDEDGNLDQDIEMMLDNVRQIIMLVPPAMHDTQQLEEAQKMLRRHIRRDEVTILTLANHATPELQAVAGNTTTTDFYIPYLANFPSLPVAHADPAAIPKELYSIFEMMIDRLERSNTLGIFIPSTIDVNQNIDTRPYVDRSLNFLAERFGGATCKEANGVWNSDTAGLVGETVYIIYTYVTQNDMNKYLDEVIEYVKGLKTELRQEAMAIEVNQRMTLV